MSGLDRLAALGGPWLATYQLRGDPSFDGDSPSTASVAPMLGGTFVQIAYTWVESGEPQEGLLVIGHEPGTDAVSAVWLDSWHNGHRMMACEGQLLADGGIDVFGTYPAGDGPPWGWRTRIAVAEDGWSMTMFNVSPAGDEALAVAADYRRA